MKKVIFILVLIASILFGAECSNEVCRCIDVSMTIDCSHNVLRILPDRVCNFENSTSDTGAKSNISIDLSYNMFDEYPEESKYYTFVNISYNNLTEFDPTFVVETKILDVSSNKIKSMSLHLCRNLENLYAANNRLNENDFKCQSETCDLSVLDLSRNKLNDLEFVTHFTKILALDVSSNTIKSIPLNLPRSIVRLNISRNNLTEVKKTDFAGLKDLEILDLSDNSISTVDENAFAELLALNILDLSGNNMVKLPSLNLGENVRNVLLMNNQIKDMDGKVVLKLLNSTDREVDVGGINFIDIDLQYRFLLILNNSGIDVNRDENCTCIDVSRGNATLKFCIEKQREEDGCWMERTTTASPSSISTTTTLPENSSVARITEGNASRAEGVNEAAQVEAAEDGSVVEAAAFLGLGGAKLSFLGFLLLTFLALLVANCVVGDPVVGERWWEETLRGDRVVS